MNLVCPRCRARLSVSIDRVPPEGRRGRCTKCGEVFLVKPPRSLPREPEDMYDGPVDVDAAPPEELDDFPLADPAQFPSADRSARLAVSASPAPIPPPAAPLGPASPPPVAVHAASPPPPVPVASAAPRTAADAELLSRTVHLPAGSITVSAVAGQRFYRLRDAHGSETTLERSNLIRMIREGMVGPDDTLAEDSSPYKTAGEFDDLRRYFHLAVAPVTVPPVVRYPGAALLGCTTHPAAHAAWCCGMCGSYWCTACTVPKAIANTWVTPCARCSEPCMPVAEQVEVVPFWREIGSLVAYPVKGWGVFMWMIYAVLSWFSALAMGNFFGWVGGLLIYFLLVTYSMLIVKDSAEGGRKVPDWPDFSMWWEVVARGFRGFICSVIALLPLIAFVIFVAKTFGVSLASEEGWGAAGFLLIGGLPLLAFTFVYYPMAFLIACVFDTILPALNPVLIFRAIARIPFDYAVALLFIGVLVVAGFLLSRPFSYVPLLGGLLGAIVTTYFQFVWLHVLGRMAHQGEARLNWIV